MDDKSYNELYDSILNKIKSLPTKVLLWVINSASEELMNREIKLENSHD